MLRVEHIGLHLGSFALKDVSFEVRRGQRFVLLGPTGCGKTLLAEIVCGLRALDAGCVRLNGRDITRRDPARRNIGYVPQDYALLPFKTVECNVAFGLEARRLARAEVARRVGEMLELLGISRLAARLPRHLSGGERQRVTLARALVIRPDLLVLDEPLSALDEGSGEETIALLRTLQAELNTTTLHICHRLEEAFALADTMGLMRDGALEQVAPPPELLSRPRSRFVAQFLRLSNLVEGEVRDLPEGRAFCVDGAVWTRTDRPGGPARAVVPLDALSLSLTRPPDDPRQVVVADVIAENRPCALRPFVRLGGRLRLTVPGAFPAGAWTEGRTAYLAVPRDRLHVVPEGPAEPPERTGGPGGDDLVG
ncbi:MAG: ABC transporter ATP-binding protein [Candidatus Brocadiaceae bacterium]|nr:ABC transporter ATP-binding protein [Candidatus Brocadiaceae bacterium]